MPLRPAIVALARRAHHCVHRWSVWSLQWTIGTDVRDVCDESLVSANRHPLRSTPLRRVCLCNSRSCHLSVDINFESFLRLLSNVCICCQQSVEHCCRLQSIAVDSCLLIRFYSDVSRVSLKCRTSLRTRFPLLPNVFVLSNERKRHLMINEFDDSTTAFPLPLIRLRSSLDIVWWALLWVERIGHSVDSHKRLWKASDEMSAKCRHFRRY